MTPALRDRLERCRSLPTPPAVALALQRLTERADFGIADTTRVLTGDADLVDKLLRLTSAPLFGINRDVTGIQQAVMLLGAIPVCNLSLSLILVRDLRKTDRGDFDYDWFWRRSLVCGMAAFSIAKTQSIPRPEEVLLAALLQDVGMLALAQAVPETYPALVTNARLDHDALQEREKSEVGGAHPEVTGWLLQRWRLTPALRGLSEIAHSLDPKAPRRGEDKLHHVLSVAALIADMVWSPNRAALAQQALPRGKAALGLDGRGLDQLVQKITAALPACAGIFDVPVPNPVMEDWALDEIRGVLLPGSRPLGRSQVPTPVPFGLGVTDALDEPARERLIARHESPLVEGLLLRLCQESQAQGRPFSVALCDLDGFSALNETMGRPAADHLLKAVGHWLRMRLRGLDVAARFDGAAFLLMLVDTPLSAAEQVGERLRSQLEQAVFTASGSPAQVRVSVGCAAFSAETPSAAALVAMATQALSRAKATKRTAGQGGGASGRANQGVA